MVRLLRVKRRRDLRRQAGQFAAVSATLLLGVALFVATSEAYRNLDASYRTLYDRLRFADVTITGGPVEDLARDARESGAAAEIRTVADVPLTVGHTKLLGRVVGMPAERQPAVDRVHLVSGTYLQPMGEHGVLVEQHMASHFHLRPGDAVRVLAPGGWTEVHVVGVVASAEYLWPARSRQEVLVPPDDFGVLFVPETLARQVAPPSTLRQLVVAEADPELVVRLERAARAGGALEIVPRAEQPSNAALQEDVSGFGELALLFPLLFLTAGGMAAFILLGRLVRSQRAQIGMLTANGFDRRTIFRAYLGYGLWAGLVGGIAGAVAGAALGGWITHLYTAAISVPLTVIRPDWATPLIGVAIAIVAAGVAAALPARAAARVAPAEAMRGTGPSSLARAGVLERILAPLHRLPMRWRLAVRDVQRSPRRTVSTVIGVVLSLVLVLVSWGMLDTTDILLARQFEQVQRQDAQVYFAGGAVTEDDLAALRAVDGVGTVEPAAELEISIRGDGRGYATTLLALPPTTTMHTFFIAGDGMGHLQGNGMLVGAAVADRLGVSAGDLVTVSSPSLDRPVRLPIAGFVDEPLGTFAYISLPAVERLARSGVVDTALVRFAAGADGATVLDRLRAIPTLSAVVDSRGLERSAGQLMGFFYVFVGVMLIFGAMMSFGLMFNTVSANVAERSAEMATLRAAGVSRRTISGILTRENLLVTAIGIVPGLLLGYLFAAAFMASFSSDLFAFSLHVRWTTLVASAAAMALVALVSEWPALRAVGRIDVARVVRERSV